MRAFNLSLALLVVVAILALTAQFAFGQSFDPSADKSQDVAFQVAVLCFCTGMIVAAVGGLIASHKHRAGTNVLVVGAILIAIAIVIFVVAELS